MILQEVSSKRDDDAMDTSDTEKQLCFSLFSKFIKEVCHIIFMLLW